MARLDRVMAELERKTVRNARGEVEIGRAHV